MTQEKSTTLPELVIAEQVAKAVGVSIVTLQRWVKSGDFPPPIRFGRRIVRWRADAIDAWLQRQNEQPSDQPIEEPA